MEKSSDEAWKKFQQSATYKTMMNHLTALMATAKVPEPEIVAELIIKTSFTQGYIYRNL